MDADEIRLRIARVDCWWHSIEVAPGVWTPGDKSPELLREEIAAMRLDALDLRGKDVIDVGAWDGFFSFEAERRGAARGAPGQARLRHGARAARQSRRGTRG